jgi:membrane protease YdiL (CAAX protease family)
MTATTASPRPGIWRAISSLALVRLVVMGVVLLAAYVAAQVGMIIVGKHVSTALITLAVALIPTLALLALYVGLVRLFERRAATELAVGPGVGWAGLGVLIGLVLFVATYLVLLGLGVASWQGVVGVSGLAPAAAATLVTAVGEELVFRGVVFRVLEDSLGTLLALALSAALFGLLHAGNPGATPVSTAAIALEAGVLLGAAYSASRNLWLPIGLHFGWNFTEGGVFGATVSGHGSHGLVSAPLSAKAPILLSGGAFGPEASAVAVAVCLAASLVLAVAAVRAGRWKPVSFRMRLP